MFHARRWEAATVLIACFGVGGAASADTLNVPDDYTIVQEAIDFAGDGDEVVIAPGEYFENINFNGKAITVRGTDPTNPATILSTIINGGGLDTVVTCDSGEGADTVLSGLLITNGMAELGGGMFNLASSPTVTNCAFSANSAVLGGGMYNLNFSNPTVTNCTFNGNSADDNGGGMFNSNGNPTVAGCSFSHNEAELGDGGGMYNEVGNPKVVNCSFNENTAGDDGGGMYNESGHPTISDCSFTKNTALDDAGGMFNDFSSSPMISDCSFTENTASDDGGGMKDILGSNATVGHCTFRGNSAGDNAGGMLNSTIFVTVTNCTFSGNSAESSDGGGMYHDPFTPAEGHGTSGGNWVDGAGMSNRGRAQVTVTNCTFSGNSADSSGGGMYNATLDLTVANCTFSGNSAGSDGGGIYTEGGTGPSMTNSVLCQNTPDQIFGVFGDVGGNAISNLHCVPLPPVKPESDCDLADVNGDGQVDPLDSGFVLARFGCLGGG